MGREVGGAQFGVVKMSLPRPVQIAQRTVQ